MADAASFVISLVDKVTGPAKAQSKALEKLQQQIKKTGQFGAQHHERSDGMIGPISPKALAAANRANLRMMATAKISSVANSAIDGVAEKAMTVAKWGAIGATAAGAALGYSLVKNTVHMANFKESSMVAFKSLTGSQELAGQAWNTTLSLSQKLGMNIEDVGGSMKHLLAMQFKLPEAEELVKLSADLTSVTGDAHSAERALVAMTQIKAKGKLQQEELTGQLAEAGVSTTLVYDELRKALGPSKTNADIMAAITAGKVDSDMAITAIKGAIMHKTHSAKAGDAGIAFNQSTFSGLWNQMKMAPQFLFVRLADSVKTNLDRLKPLVQRITGAIDGIQGDQMTRFVGSVLGFAERLVPLAISFAEGFGEGFTAMNDALGGLDPSAASLETAKEMGKAMAHAFELALQAITKLMEAITWLDQHRGVAAGVAGMLAIDKVAGAGATAKGLYSAGKWGVGKMIGQTAATAAGSAAATGAFGSLGGTAAAAGGGLTGSAALAAGLTTVAGGAAALGGGILAGAGIGYIFREEIASLFGYGGTKGVQGLGAPQPTSTMKALEGATARAPTQNNVRFESQIHIDGTNSDPNQIARDVSDRQRGMMEQFFQSQALEQGATG